MSSAPSENIDTKTIFNESGKVLKRTFDEMKTKFPLLLREEGVTLSEILEWKKTMGTFQIPATAKIMDYSIKQSKAEEVTIIERGNCPLSRRLETGDVIAHLNSLDIRQAADIVKTSYLRGEGAPAAMSCVVGSVGSDSSSSADEGRITVGRIRNYFKEPKVISKGANGAVILFKFQNDVGDDASPERSLFLLKAPLNPASASQRDGTHEAFVGFFALNQLRNIIPNFMYTYAAFRCTPPVLPYSVSSASAAGGGGGEGTKIIDAWCSLNKPTHSNNVTYTIIENLANRKDGKTLSLKKFIKKSKESNEKVVEEFMSLLSQIVAALGIAWETCEFTHYDLHDENVLVRELPFSSSATRRNNVVLDYDLRGEGKAFRIRAQNIATIIDYGMSHVSIGDVHFGHASDSLMEYGVLRDRGNPHFDVFKIVCFSILTFLESKRLSSSSAEDQKLLDCLYELLYPFVKGADDASKRAAAEEIIAEGMKMKTPFYYDYVFLNRPFSFSTYLEHIDRVCRNSSSIIRSPMLSEAEERKSSSPLVLFDMKEFDRDFERIKSLLLAPAPPSARPTLAAELASSSLLSRSARVRRSRAGQKLLDDDEEIYDYAILLDLAKRGRHVVKFNKEEADKRLIQRLEKIEGKIKNLLSSPGIGKTTLPSTARMQVVQKVVFTLAVYLIVLDYLIQATNLLSIYNQVGDDEKTLVAAWTKRLEEIKGIETFRDNILEDLKNIKKMSVVARFGGRSKFDTFSNEFPLISYGYDLLQDLFENVYGKVV